MKVFNIASRFLDRKNTIPVLGMFKLDFKDNTLTLTATNLDRTFSTSVPCTANDGTVLVDGQRLSALMSKIEDVSFDVGDKLTVKHRSGKASFATYRDDTYPKIVAVSDAEPIIVSGDDLRETFKAVLCGTDEDKVDGRSFRNVCEFRVSANTFTCASWDTQRLVVASGVCVGSDKVLQIPLGAVQTLLPLLESGDVEIREDANHLFVSNNDNHYVFRKTTVNFPQVVAQLQAAKFVEGFTCDASELFSALDTVGTLMDARLKSVKWTLGEDVTFSINNSEVGNVEQHLDVKPLIQIETGYNLTWLLPIVRQLDGDVRCEFFADQVGHTLRVRKSGDIEVNFVVASLRVN